MKDAEYPDDSELGGLWRPGPITRPRATVRTPINGDINQQTDNSVGKRVNEALPWCVMAAAFGFLGFGGMIAVALLKPWETEGRAIRAEVRAEFAERIANQDAYIEVAKYEASLAKTIAQRLDEQSKLKR